MYTQNQLSEILDEIVKFEVQLEEDPTLPSLGNRYLNEKLAVCRKYLNRVIFYMQVVSKQAKDVSIEVKKMELDLEFKMAEKLSDDPIVKQQPSIDDRKALASTLLSEEFDNLKQLRLELIDVTETLKIIKMKHQDLVRTNTDIKTQKQIVKDTEYDKPSANKDKTIPGGMPPPIMNEKIDPKDILDPNKRPDDFPEPIDEMHAKLISEFYSNSLVNDNSIQPENVTNDIEEKKVIEYDDDVINTIKVISIDI